MQNFSIQGEINEPSNEIKKESESTDVNLNPKNQSTCAVSWKSFEYYEQFFKVNQSEVLERIKLSFMPWQRIFMEKINQNPDFYGPLWVATTVIFLLCSVGNLARYFSVWEKSAYIFKPQLVRYSVLLVYGCLLAQPIMVYGALKIFKFTKVSFAMLLCIYGYSFGGFIVALILSAIPVEWVQWLLMVYGTLNSVVFLVLNLHNPFAQLEHKRFVIYGIVGAVQIFLFLIFKLVFFEIIYDSSP